MSVVVIKYQQCLFHNYYAKRIILEIITITPPTIYKIINVLYHTEPRGIITDAAMNLEDISL